MLPIRPLTLLATVLATATIAAGCGGDGATPTEVVLVTHDSFAVSEATVTAFTEETGYTLRILQTGDAGATLNRALLTEGKPEGDVLFGVDDNLVSRALDGELLESYASPVLGSVGTEYRPDDERLTPIDHGEVCLNADRAWFAKHALELPRSLEELTLPQYRGLLVVENAATSSPGLAFLLATVERYGDHWQGFWRKLVDNDVKVTEGWEQAYTQQFSGAAGSPGKRPLVVSYATSPAAEVIFAGTPLDESPTVAIEDGCFRQVEYAGVLRGARNPDGARALIDFMLSETFQKDVPGSMFVYPVRDGVALPEAFIRHALVPVSPLRMDPARIAENRDRWVDEWTAIVLR